MTILYLKALLAIAVSLSILMALAWLVQQRSGNSGWVDTIWTFAVGLVRFRGDTGKQGRRLRRQSVALAASPELLLRMALLARLPVIALSFTNPWTYPWGLATLLAPVFMYWILVYVTGIPPLEEQMLSSRGERYRAYQSRTSKFFPLP